MRFSGHIILSLLLPQRWEFVAQSSGRILWDHLQRICGVFDNSGREWDLTT